MSQVFSPCRRTRKCGDLQQQFKVWNGIFLRQAKMAPQLIDKRRIA